MSFGASVTGHSVQSPEGRQMVIRVVTRTGFYQSSEMFRRTTKFLLHPGLSEQEEGTGQQLDRAGAWNCRSSSGSSNLIQLKSAQRNPVQLNLT